MRARDAGIRELLDEATLDAAALRRNLADIRRINALLGWTGFAVRAVLREAAAARPGGFSLLDVASGSGDIARAIARAAARRGIAARVVVTDLSAPIVAIARAYTSGTPGLRVEQQDALALPYPAGAFDLALCTLAIHHFEPERAVALLRGLGRVGRRVLVFDVERSTLAWAGAVLLTRALHMDAVTRHDAPASVRRAYTAPELRTLAARAGLRGVRVRVGFPFRLALVADGAGA